MHHLVDWRILQLALLCPPNSGTFCKSYDDILWVLLEDSSEA